MPRLSLPGVRQHEVERDLAGRQPERLEVQPQGLPLGRDPEEAAPRLIELLHPALAIDQGHRERAPVHHRVRPFRRGARAAHRLGELESARDVGRDRREVLQLDQPEGRRLVGRGTEIAHHRHRPDDAARRLERREHGRPRGAGRREGLLRVRLGEDVVREERFA